MIHNFISLVKISPVIYDGVFNGGIEMIVWSDIKKGELPEHNKNVLWYESMEMGYIDINNGFVYMDFNQGHWVDLAYGFDQPSTVLHQKLPLDIARFWTIVNDPEES